MEIPKIILLLTLLFSISNIGIAQQIGAIEKDWKLVKDTDGIQVYTRMAENSKFKEIRIQALFKANIDTLFNKLNNPDTYTDWVYKCTQGKILEKKNDQEFHYYTVSNLPFPAKNRDMVVKCKQWVDEDGTKYSHSVAAPDFIPTNNNLVRIPHFVSNWKIIPLANGMIQVDYTALADPGGKIPIWMVNLAVSAGPFKTMKKLIESVSNHI